MNKRERMIQKIEAEPDQWKRIIMKVQYVCDYGSEEDKDRTEEILQKAAGYPEKLEV